MTEPQASFLGAVLKAVVSTPNEGKDAALYQREVVEVTRGWRRQFEEGAPLSADQKCAVLIGLSRIFEVKRVPRAEAQDRLREILSVHDPDGAVGRALPPEVRP
ncbi:MAG: hypothetical protein U1E65_13290 [Myxococcota bacterium]